jgi:hypothetical protein
VVGLTSSDFWWGWFSFSLIPCSCRLFGVGVGVAGWNIESGSWFSGFLVRGFGTLLGPEETPLWVFAQLPVWIV